MPHLFIVPSSRLYLLCQNFGVQNTQATRDLFSCHFAPSFTVLVPLPYT